MSKRFFAKINSDTKEVVEVLIYEGVTPNFPEGELWVETFRDGSQRKNFAGIGYTYYAEYDAFVPINSGTDSSRVLNYTTFQWDPKDAPPAENPDHYYWDDDYEQWITLVGPANNGGYDNADLLGFSTTTPNKLWNSSGNVVGVAS